MKVFVTGCAGFIGSNFCKTFQKRFKKATIVGIDNFATGRREEVPVGIEFYEGSILDEQLLEKIFSKHKIDYVFHFAALPRVSFSVQNPVLTTEVNILGTVKIMDVARRHGVKRVIYSSSSSVYGGAKKLPTKEKENPANPRSPYALQKYFGEPMGKIFSEIYGLDTVALRYFNVFGPGQYGDSPYSTVTSAWLEALYFNKRPYMEGDGKQSKDYTYIDNVVNANILAMQCKQKLNGEVFNVGSGQQIDLWKIKKLIEKHTGKILDLERRPPRVGDVKKSKADTAKAKKILGYKPEVLYEEGLQRTIGWFEQRIRN